jgi:hypothetical protein
MPLEVNSMAILAAVDAVLYGKAWNGLFVIEMVFSDIDTLGTTPIGPGCGIVLPV